MWISTRTDGQSRDWGGHIPREGMKTFDSPYYPAPLGRTFREKIYHSCARRFSMYEAWKCIRLGSTRDFAVQPERKLNCSFRSLRGSSTYVGHPTRRPSRSCSSVEPGARDDSCAYRMAAAAAAAVPAWPACRDLLGRGRKAGL